jgi:DNA-binding NarL/FixJ family response regulator
MIRVLVVDDNAVFRQGMRDLFAAIEDLDVVGVAGDGATGVQAALELQPDVVLMDLAMPGTPGIEATRRLTAAAPHIGVVVMTMLEDDEAVVQALRAGARGYLVKGARQNEILDVVRGVSAGRAVIGATVARQLSTLVTGGAPADPFPELTARERDVLAALTAGASTAQVAGRLGLSDKTVRNHVSSILTKLEVPDRTQAVLKARAAGLQG